MDRSQPAETLSVAVLEAVAESEDADLVDLPTMGEAIDVEALDDLFSPRYDGTPRVGGRIRFPYAGYAVEVRSDGRVELDEI